METKRGYRGSFFFDPSLREGTRMNKKKEIMIFMFFGILILSFLVTYLLETTGILYDINKMSIFISLITFVSMCYAFYTRIIQRY